MLPVVAGTHETVRQIRLYALALVPVAAAPWLIGYAGLLYGVTAVFAGAIMVALAWRVRDGGREAKRCSATRFSISSCSLLCC